MRMRLIVLSENDYRSHPGNLEAQIAACEDGQVIDELVVVTEHGAGDLDSSIRRLQSLGAPVRTLHNPFRAVSGSLLSLWLARTEMTEDFLVTTDDATFSAEMLRSLFRRAGHGPTVAIHEVASASADRWTTGLVAVQGRPARAVVRDCLEALARDPDRLDKHWLELFHAMPTGAEVQPWRREAGSWLGSDAGFPPAVGLPPTPVH